MYGWRRSCRSICFSKKNHLVSEHINGRNAISWEEKFEMDVWYVDHWSIWLDLKIIALTVLKVLRREGISAEGEATMVEFMGSE